MIATIRVRLATPADAATIAGHNAAMALETEGRALDASVLRAGVEAVLCDRDRGVYYLAERRGTVAGQMLVTREWSDWRNAWFWWIQSVYVLPTERRHGVYRRLHEHVRAAAVARGDVCGLRLYVERENHAAQAVYRRVGLSPANYALYEVDWSLQRPQD